MLVAAIVGGCISAGLWQLRRLDERRDRNAQVRARSTEVVDLPAGGFAEDADEDDLIFRRVRVAGTYDAANELLVRFRSRKGLPGYEVVTPLRTDDGVVLVNRGWVPLDVGDRWPDEGSAAPSGEVEVEGLLVPAESGPVRLANDDGDGDAEADAAPKIAAIDPARLGDAVGAASGPIYALPMLATDATDAFPAPVDPPDLGEGPHRDYAIQWFLFASVGIVGWPLLLFRRGPLARKVRS